MINNVECPKCKSHNLEWDEDDYGSDDHWRCLDCNWRFKDKKQEMERMKEILDIPSLIRNKINVIYTNGTCHSDYLFVAIQKETKKRVLYLTPYYEQVQWMTGYPIPIMGFKNMDDLKHQIQSYCGQYDIICVQHPEKHIQYPPFDHKQWDQLFMELVRLEKDLGVPCQFVFTVKSYTDRNNFSTYKPIGYYNDDMPESPYLYKRIQANTVFISEKQIRQYISHSHLN